MWTWAAAAAFAALLVGGLAVFSERELPAARSYFFGLDRLSSPARATDTVVIIGTSKTRCAVEPDAVLAARTARLGQALRFVRITRDEATADDFPEVFAAVTRSRPRLVLIESDLLAYEPKVYRNLAATPRRDWRNTIRDMAQYALKRGSFYTAAAENRAVPHERTCRYGDGDPVARRAALATRSASTAADRAPFMAFIAALHDAGTPVALLRFPRRMDAIGEVPPALEAAGEAVRRGLLHDPGITDLGQPVQISSDDFSGVHLDPRGRAQYSAWLAGRIAATLRPPAR